MSKSTLSTLSVLQRYRLSAAVACVILSALSLLDLQSTDSPALVQYSRIMSALFLFILAVFASKDSIFAKHLSISVFITLFAFMLHLSNTAFHNNLSPELVVMMLVNLALNGSFLHSKKLALAVFLSWSIVFTAVAFSLPNPEYSAIYFLINVIVVSAFTYLSLVSFLNAKNQLEANEIMLIKSQKVARIAGWQFDVKAEKVTWSKTAFDLLGGQGDTIDIDIKNLFTGQDKYNEFEREVFHCINEGRELDKTVEIFNLEGKRTWFQCRGDVIYRNNIATGMVGVILNVTDNVLREKELIKARALAETAAQARTRFLANMSHEIRTPMNGVIGMTSILLNGNLPEKEKKHVDIIRRSGESLLTIINEILDFSKYDSDNVILEEEFFSMHELVSDTVDVVATQAENKGLKIYLSLPLLPHAEYAGDSSRLKQVLVNLLGNAIKFTEEGSITLSLDVYSKTKDTMQFRFRVLDTGIGIAQHNIKNLFDPFTQEDASTTRRFGGTGLGLAITKEIVTAMQGEIKVTSRLKEGSCFDFTIKMKAGNLVDNNSKKLGEIAIIQADPTLNELLTQSISSLGGTPHIFRYPAALHESDTELTTLSAILLDSDYANHDDCKLLTSDSKLSPLLIFVGSSTLQPKTLPYNAAWLRTPVRISELEKVLENKQLMESDVCSGEVPIADFSTFDILLAEDNIVNQKVAQHILAKLGCDIDIAENGKEAIHFLSKKPYDIIFMDIQMPEIDGLEATELIRSDPELEQPYIIAMTANVMEDDRQQCLSAGMNNFISKPVRISDLSAALEKARYEIFKNQSKNSSQSSSL